MFISGHKEIMENLLNIFKNKYFKKIKNFNNVNITNITIGMQYPDLPCGKYRFNDDNEYIIMTDNSLCPIIKLYKILFKEYEFSEIFQSHNGFNSYLHSMSYNDGILNKNIYDKILTYIVGCLLLSIYDKQYYKINDLKPEPNIFWIGVILHMITDSYSPSHTIRFKNIKTEFPYKIKIDKDARIVRLIKKYISNLNTIITSEDKLKNILLKHFANENKQAFIKENIHHIFKVYKLFLFHIQVNNKINSLNLINNDESVPIITKSTTYDIQYFQYYENQSTLYHNSKDLMLVLNNYPKMYKRMINECKFIMINYRNCLINIKNDRDNHLNYAKQFINTTYNFIKNNTYRMDNNSLNRKSGRIYK